MKPKTDLSYGKMIFFGLLTEMVLIAIQFMYSTFFETGGSEKIIFSYDYMRQAGFMIFQIVGFFVYVLATFMLLRKIKTGVISKMILFLVVGSLVELAFYFMILDTFEAPFIFSIIDKLPAASYGALYYYFADGRKAAF